MGARASPVNPEELLSHVEWVRRLARSLVTGEDRADDVAQETWLHALKAPPGDPGNVRGWLTRVAQNVARKLARGEERRGRREAGAPPPSPLPTPAESFERAALQRRVVDALLALDELYRAPLLLRFFEELAPADVARALGVPLETARTRIKRGLALVRERLLGESSDAVASQRGLELALAPLLSWPISGVAIMSGTLWKLAGAAVVVVALSWFLLHEPELKPAAPTPAAAASSPPAAEVGAAPLVADATRASEPSAPVPDDGRVLLHGFVVDTAGALVPASTITWDDSVLEAKAADPARRTERTASAKDGEYAIPPLARGVVRFQLKSTGYQPLATALDLTDGESVQRHDFVLTKSFLVPFKIVKPDGTPLLHDENPAPEVSELAWGMAIVASDAPLPPLLPPSQRSNYDGKGIGRTIRKDHRARGEGVPIPEGTEGVVDVPHLPVELSLLMKNVVVQHHPVTAADPVVTFTIDPTLLAEQMGKVVGRFVDERSGAPIEGVRVGLSDLSRGGGGQPVGADGRFELGPMAPGFLKLDVFSDIESHHRWLLVEPGKINDRGDIVLARGTANVKGTVLAPDGKPVTASLQVLRQDLLVHGLPFGSHDYWSTEEPGKLALSRLGRHRYALVARANYDNGACAIADVEILGGDPPPIVLQLEPKVSVTFVSGIQAADVPLMVELATATGATFMARSWSDPDTENLPPGRYVLSLYDRSRLVRAVPFEVGREPIRVEFTLDGKGPVAITPATTEAPNPLADEPSKPVRPGPVEGPRSASLLIVGRITDRAGQPVVGARISTSDLHGRSRSGSIAPDGSFAIGGLSSGRIDVVARAEGCVETSESIELTEGGAPRRVDLVLERTTRVKVKLTELAGAPLEKTLRKKLGASVDQESLRVMATFDEPELELSRDSLGAFGQWLPTGTINGDGGGMLEIGEPLPVFVSVVFAGQVLASEELTEPKAELTLAADVSLLDARLASVRFRLVDAVTHEPILRAGVMVMAPNAWGQPPLTDLPPGSNGVWTFDRQPPGKRNVCINIEGFEYELSVQIELAAAQENDLGDIPIVRDFELHGRIVDEQGHPVKTEVSIESVDAEGRRSGNADLRAPVGEDGRFTARVTTPRIRVRAGSDWAIDPLFVDVLQLGATSEVVLVVRRGTLVTLRPPRGMRDAESVEIRRADGSLLYSSILRGPVARQIRLAPGSYRILVERDGTPPSEKSFTVTDAPMELSLGG